MFSELLLHFSNRTTSGSINRAVDFLSHWSETVRWTLIKFMSGARNRHLFDETSFDESENRRKKCDACKDNETSIVALMTHVWQLIRLEEVFPFGFCKMFLRPYLRDATFINEVSCPLSNDLLTDSRLCSSLRWCELENWFSLENFRVQRDFLEISSGILLECNYQPKIRTKQLTTQRLSSKSCVLTMKFGSLNLTQFLSVLGFNVL